MPGGREAARGTARRDRYPSGPWWRRALLVLCALGPLAVSAGLTVRDCLDLCAGTAGWTLFGFRFQHFGVAFFLLLTGLSLSAALGRLRRAGVAVGAMVSAAAGAEFAFLYIQKFVVKEWCPWCVTIAAFVFVAAALVAADYFGKIGRGSAMERKEIPGHVLKGMAFVALLLASTAATFVGTAFHPPEAVGEEASTLDTAIGKGDADVTVLIFTDWLCPVCRRVEQELGVAYPEFAARHRLRFVDHVVKPESLNFIPYNLSFLVREKAKYFEIRRRLEGLAETNVSPTQEEVQKAVSPLGVAVKPLSFLEVNRGVAFFKELSETYKVKGAPTVVVESGRTKKRKVLLGGKQISVEKVRAAIEEVGRP